MEGQKDRVSSRPWPNNFSLNAFVICELTISPNFQFHIFLRWSLPAIISLSHYRLYFCSLSRNYFLFTKQKQNTKSWFTFTLKEQKHEHKRERERERERDKKLNSNREFRFAIIIIKKSGGCTRWKTKWVRACLVSLLIPPTHRPPPLLLHLRYFSFLF